MSIDAELADALVIDVAKKVRAARSIDDALRSVAGALIEPLYVVRVSVRLLDATGERLVVHGVWTLGTTAIGPGVSLPVGSTSFGAIEAAGRTVTSGWDAGSYPPLLLDQVMRDEGILSFALVPLRSAGVTVGVLAISSRDEQAFTDEDARIFDALGAAVEEPLLALARSDR